MGGLVWVGWGTRWVDLCGWGGGLDGWISVGGVED